MTIGEIARRTGLATSAIRYYEEIGLLPPAPRVSGQRVYGEETVDRLRVILFARDAGFTLREIRQLFESRWRKLVASKLAEVDESMARLGTMKRLLREIERCGCVDLRACRRVLDRA
jgi:DNA-binding transcriptional MerR regulator